MVIAKRTFSKAIASLAASGAAAACFAVATDDAASASRCVPSGSKTLAQTASVRVYQVRKARVYGCLFSSGKARRLDQGTNFPVQRSTLRIQGRFVGFARGKSDATADDLSVNVVDLRDGDTIHSADPGGGLGGTVLIRDLEVTRNGAVAWIANVEAAPRERLNEVSTADSTGVHKRDAATPTAGISSLAVSGNRVYWMKADTPVSIALS